MCYLSMGGVFFSFGFASFGDFANFVSCVKFVSFVVVGVGVAGARGGVAGIHRGGARVSEGIGEMNLKRVCGSGLSGVVVGRVWVYILW